MNLRPSAIGAAQARRRHHCAQVLTPDMIDLQDFLRAGDFVDVVDPRMIDVFGRMLWGAHHKFVQVEASFAKTVV